MELEKFIKSLDLKEYEQFVKNNPSNLKATTKVHKVISDTSWIEMIEESIPYLDNIIRNPRRFIVQEENIVPIEKAKVVTEESIRHLAQNTNLIQDVDEDGNVIPLKLLNVYREETVDLYENRFIKSLVDNLYQFVNNKLAESDQKSHVDADSQVTYEVATKNGKETLNVTLKLESKQTEEMAPEKKDGHSLETRIEHIKDVLAAFMGSQFIKSLQASQPVRSPIRKTNVILKEQNFIKALELWEYLESNNIKPMTEVTDETLDREKELKAAYDFAFFVQNEALKLNKDEKYDKVKVAEDLDLRMVITKLLKEDNLAIKDVKALVNKEIKKYLTIEKAKEKEIAKEFKKLGREYESCKQKAFELLK